MKKTIYWAVTAKCGHVGGLTKYIPITFYVLAASKKAASDYVIARPRVKHHNKGVILEIKNISYDEYVEGLLKNSSDIYLKCGNIQEQRSHYEELENRIVEEDDEMCLKRYHRIFKKSYCRENKYKNNINRRRYDEKMEQYCREFGFRVA